MKKLLIATTSFGADKKVLKNLKKKFRIITNKSGKKLTTFSLSYLIKNVHYVIAGTEIYNKDVLKNAKNLKTIFRFGSGTDNIDFNFCKKNNIKFKSIYITNPWGIYEEKKLNFYLIKKWFNNKNPIISHPNYIRDNIYIDNLSKSYKKIVLSKSNKIHYFPSGICSSNKLFIEAFKKKFEKFFNKKVKVTYANNSIYNQPICRINGDRISKKVNIKQNLNNYFLYYQKILTN